MGFFKSVKKKLNLFKKQLRKIIPNEIIENPAITASLIIGGFVPFGESQQSLFARGASNIGGMVSDPKGYFTNLNDKFGFGTKLVGTGQKVWTPAGEMAETKKYQIGFLGKGVDKLRGFVGGDTSGGKIASSFLQKYLKESEKESAGDKIQNIQVRSDYGKRITSGVPHKGFQSASAQIKPGYRNRYVQSSLYNILSNPNYKQIWSGGINSGEMISIYQSSGPTMKLESSKIG